MPHARLLIVDDEAPTVQALQTLLGGQGYATFVVASAGADALAQAEALRPDLALLDARLGDESDGIALGALLRKRLGIPVLFLTALADPETIERASAVVPAGYLLKPFRDEAVVAMVRVALAQARAAQAEQEALSRIRSELWHARAHEHAFLASVTHELRTPLHVILGYTATLAEGRYGPISEQQHEALERIGTSSRRLAHEISTILDLTALRTGRDPLDLTALQLGPLCWRSAQRAQPAASRKSIRIRLDVDQCAARLIADERRLMQILGNLLDNAIKFTPERGKVGMIVRCDRERQVVTMTVWDTGIGMPAEHIGRSFEPFVQLEHGFARAYEGLGLGLTLAARLVDLHGGSIQVASTPGAGSRFTVTLPWDTSRARPDGRRKPDKKPALRVLIADDHEPTLQRLADTLKALGTSVSLAREGTEAVRRIQTERPDFAVLDAEMPGMDGLNVIQVVRHNPALAATAIIALSTLDTPGARERYLGDGAYAYLPKPAMMGDFVTLIPDLAARQAQHADRPLDTGAPIAQSSAGPISTAEQLGERAAGSQVKS